MKKTKTILLIILALIITSGTFAYATVEYTKSTTTSHNVTVGNTTKTVDGLTLELLSYDNSTLTYFELEETLTEKHYLTYSYTYDIVAYGDFYVQVDSLSSDIVLNAVTCQNSVCDVTFSLNQELTLNEGDTINVLFQFSLVEIETLGNYNVDNPLNINNVTDVDLYATLDISAVEAYNIVKNNDYTSLQDVMDRVNVSIDLVDLYQHYVDKGVITFE